MPPRMNRPSRIGSVVAAALSLLPASARSAAPEVVSIEKVWDRGAHNAFTDLARWRGGWYCTFREAEGHVRGDGKVRVLVSADGKAWESSALIAEEGVDLRDPKLSVTPDDRLMIVAGGSVYHGTTTLKGRRPRVLFSKDGRDWTAPKPILSEGEWLWRVTWHDGKAYGISYSPPVMDPKGPAEWALKLFVSGDGVRYDLLKVLDVPGHPNESTVRFLPDGEMVALVRREAGGSTGWVGTSRPPYTDWKWNETGHRLGGPNFIRLPDGSLVAASRSLGPGGPKTVVARMTRTSYEPVLTLPSGGDTSYPGLVWHNGLLWVSYYSSHEGKASVYLARVKVPLAPEDVGSRLEPFVDEHLLDRLAGSARLEVQRPEPRELVFTADKPWEGNTSAYYTLFQDGERYRMYYRGAHFDESTRKESHREVTCYAESRDGLHWTRPDLGLFAFDGSRHNNIVWDGPGAHNFTPVLDTNPGCPPGAKYKALAGGRPGLIAYQSADGIHWSRMREAPVITRGAFDSQNLAFWHGNAGTYREYHREFRGVPGVRDIMTGTSADFLKWTDPDFITIAHAPRQHLYTNAVLPYVRAPHILIGFPTRFLPETEQVEPTFMASRDGRNFRRYEGAVIPRSAPKDRDGNRSNYMTWGLLQLPGRDHELSVYATEAYYTGPGSRVRRFAYRLDGFVALHAGAEGGEATTRPLRFRGGRLALNARTGERGRISVELQDPDGNPIDGFRASDCRPLSGDETAAEVSWSGPGDLSALAGKPVRLRFVLAGADLFSFRFK
jgi:hypothetical protein